MNEESTVGMIKIVDNLVSESYADKLENLCKQLPWYWYENISGSIKSLSEDVSTEGFQYGFSHLAMMDGEKRSPELENFMPLVYFMEEKLGIKVNQIYRVRVALNTWTGLETTHHAHVDMEIPHKVLLYYVNDSDGDTVMYNEMHDLDKEDPGIYTLKEKITPKKNRAVVFDGWRYHSSSKPTNVAGRFIVNIDFN